MSAVSHSGYTLSHDRAHVHRSPELYAICGMPRSAQTGQMEFAGDMLAIIALLVMAGLAERETRAYVQHYKSKGCVEGITQYLVDRTYKASF